MDTIDFAGHPAKRVAAAAATASATATAATSATATHVLRRGTHAASAESCSTPPLLLGKDRDPRECGRELNRERPVNEAGDNHLGRPGVVCNESHLDEARSFGSKHILRHR
jgi:hypothetical protein